ncbi:MAG: hypothetical protein Q9168_002576 [Polycauliona sp. 1 TL-2023]
MGLLHTYFLSHDWPEDTDDLMSKVNKTEAAMICEFFNYLVKNGVKPKDITVLTFYNGQRKIILSNLRQHPNLQSEIFKVVTVDSYQGEENGIVLLSLVRSNTTNSIGFLSVANRVCVALSRAQQGFYIFGDASLLSRQSRLWLKVIKAMTETPRRVGMSRGESRGRSSPTKKAHSPRKNASSSPIKEPHSETLMALTPEAQPFRDFAGGGYVAADADVAAKQRRQQQMAAETHTARFGSDNGMGELIDTSLLADVKPLDNALAKKKKKRRETEIAPLTDDQEDEFHALRVEMDAEATLEGIANKEEEEEDVIDSR